MGDINGILGLQQFAMGNTIFAGARFNAAGGAPGARPRPWGEDDVDKGDTVWGPVDRRFDDLVDKEEQALAAQKDGNEIAMTAARAHDERLANLETAVQRQTDEIAELNEHLRTITSTMGWKRDAA